MKAELSYREIEIFIRDKADKNVRVSYENSKPREKYMFLGFHKI